MSLEDLRRKYLQGGLSRADVTPNPFDQFQKWFDESVSAAPGEWYEPNAMTLATAAANGEVSSRVVLLKKFDPKGLVFFTNYDSQKGQQLTENPHASVGFYWPHLERQVRVEGTVNRVERAVSESYFHSRPRRSQIGAAASAQSSVLKDRDALAASFAELEKKWEGQEIPLPENWGGFRLTPTRFEFWQGRDNRLHDRIRYRYAEEAWVIERLSP